MELIYLIGGFAGLIAGGDLLVRGAVTVARRINVSPMIIGLTLVGFGTSTPELVTSVQAALAGAPGIAVGNVVGSNIANILLILGVAALVSPMLVSSQAFKRDGWVLVYATTLCVAIVLIGSLERMMGLFFLASLLLYLGLTIRYERRNRSSAAEVYEAEAEIVASRPSGMPLGLCLFAVGLVLTVVGAKLLVTGAISLALTFGISETIIGLTIVAMGTSMPELVTAIMASLRGQNDVAFGNVLGSNIFNILGIFGATALVQPLQVPDSIAQLDIWVMVAATALMFVFAMTGWRISRREGGVLATGYFCYLGYLVVTAGYAS